MKDIMDMSVLYEFHYRERAKRYERATKCDLAQNTAMKTLNHSEGWSAWDFLQPEGGGKMKKRPSAEGSSWNSCTWRWWLRGGNKSFFPWLPSDVTSDMQRLYVLQWKSGGCLGLRPGQCHCEPASNSRMKQESCLAGRISNCAGEIGRLTVQCLKSSHIVGAFSGSWKGPTLKLESRRGRRRKNGSRLWRKRSRLKIRKAGNCCCQDG